MENFDLIVTKNEDGHLLWILIDADYASTINHEDIDSSVDKWYILRSSPQGKIILQKLNQTFGEIYLYRTRVAPIFNVHFVSNIQDFKKKTSKLKNMFKKKKRNYDLVSYLYWNFGYIQDYKNHLTPHNLSEMTVYLDEAFRIT